MRWIFLVAIPLLAACSPQAGSAPAKGPDPLAAELAEARQEIAELKNEVRDLERRAEMAANADRSQGELLSTLTSGSLQNRERLNRLEDDIQQLKYR